MRRTQGARLAISQTATLPADTGGSSPVESTSHAPGHNQSLAKVGL